jgi:hypothetical protein
MGDAAANPVAQSSKDDGFFFASLLARAQDLCALAEKPDIISQSLTQPGLAPSPVMMSFVDFVAHAQKLIKHGKVI